MRRAACAVLLLTVFGCAETAPTAAPPAASPTASPTTPAVTAIWDVDHADPGSREVRVRFVAASCVVVKGEKVQESADRVVIALDLAGRGGKECGEPQVRYRTVRLAEPLGGRALYDGGVEPAVLVR